MIEWRITLDFLYRYSIINAAHTGTAIPSDAQYAFRFKIGLALATIWNFCVAFFDGFYEVYALAPNRACMHIYQGRTNPNLHILLICLLYTPYVLVGIFALGIDGLHYLLNSNSNSSSLVNTTQRFQQSLFQQIPFRSFLISLFIVLFAGVRAVIYNVMSWLQAHVFWILIAYCYATITLDIAKAPFQLVFLFTKNSVNMRRTTEHRRQAVIQRAREERLARQEMIAMNDTAV